MSGFRGDDIQGIADGATTVTTGTVVFSNSPTVSFGLNGNTMTASAAAGGGVAVSANGNSISAGTAVFSNSNNVSFGMNASTITATATIAATVFSNSNNVSFGLNGSTVTATASFAQSTQPVAVSGSNGSFLFSTLHLVTGNGASFYTDATGVRLTYTVPTQSVQPVAASGSNGSFNFSTITFGISNNFTFYTTNGSMVGSYTVPTVTQPVVSNAIQQVSSATGSGTNTSRFAADDHVHAGVYGAGVSNVGSTAGNTKVSFGRFVFAGSNMVTVSQQTAAGELNTIHIQATQSVQPVAVSGSNGSFNFSTVTFGNLNGVSFYTTNGSMAASYTRNAASNAIASVGSATNSGTNTSRFAADDHVHAGIFSMGVSNDAGNTVGDTRVDVGRFVLRGGNSITLSQITAVGALNTIVISGPNVAGGGFSGGISNIGNTSGNTGVTGTRLVLAGINNVTLSGSADANGATISISGANAGGAAYQSYFRMMDANNTVSFSFGQSTSHVAPFELPYYLSMDRFRILASGSVAASSTNATNGNTTLSMSAVTSHNIVIYTRGVGANSLSLQYLTSTQNVDRCLMTWSGAVNSTQHSYSLRYTLGSQSFTKDYTSNTNSLAWVTTHLTNLTGVRYLDIPLGISLSVGQYWVAYGRSTTSSTQNASIANASRLIVSHNSMIGVSQNTLAIGSLGSNTNSSVGWFPGHGSFTTGGAAGTTNSMPISAVSTTASNVVIFGQLMRLA